MGYIKRSYIKNITPLKLSKSKELQPFIVADLETILVDDYHTTYAAGLLLANF